MACSRKILLRVRDLDARIAPSEVRMCDGLLVKPVFVSGSDGRLRGGSYMVPDFQ